MLNQSTAVAEDDVCAVVVTYFPDENIVRRLEEISSQCRRTLVVNNQSEPGAAWLEMCRAQKIEVIQQERNLGLAHALNVGISRAKELGYRFVVTFDQDSTPYAGSVRALLAARQRFHAPDRVAVVGSKIHEEKLNEPPRQWLRVSTASRWCFSRVPCQDTDLAGVTFVITSGSLVDVKLYEQIGPFDEGLFIDYIDHDYCLRGIKLGFEVLVSSQASILHNMGAKSSHRLLGKTIIATNYPPVRVRYMYRNRWILARKHFRQTPHWVVFDMLYGFSHLARMMLVERNRLSKLVAVFEGTVDAIFGRSGEIV